MKKLLLILLCFPMIGFGQQSRGYSVRPEGVPKGNIQKNNSVIISNIPAYIWHRGCGPTVLGMIIGYYDLHGYDDLFQDSTNLQTNNINMSIASDEHYSDYSLPLDYYPNILQDVSEIGGSHQDNSIADYMHTSKSSYGNYWGWSWSNDIGSAFENYILSKNANYLTETEYVFYANNSWNEYKTEIDNNRPVIILVDTDGDNLTDHFVVGLGYSNSSQEFACYDSWDSSLHWYSWQGMSQNINYGIFGFTKFSLSKIPTLINEEQKYTIHKNETKVIDILGRESKQTNQPLFYIYDDGTVKRKIVIE